MGSSRDFSALWPFYLFVAGLLLILVAPFLLSQGMFMDGLIYAGISKNMAAGLGTFWNPYFSQYCMPEFHEHPPLALGIQSLFFLVFGENYLVERMYSFMAMMLAGFLLVRLWYQAGFRYGWFPLLLWISVPLVSWTWTNNMLENTLMLFTLLAVWFFFRGMKCYRVFFLLLAGFSLCLGFLTKGPFALFPLTLPLWYFIFYKDIRWKRMLEDSLILFAGTVLPLLILVTVSPVAALSLRKYFEQQVVNSVMHVITVDSRFFILKRLFFELLPAVSISCVIWLITRKKGKFFIPKSQLSLAGVFGALGMSGVIPIMISMKQSGFYMLPAFPFLIIALGILVFPGVIHLTEWLMNSRFGRLSVRTLALLMVITGILMTISFRNSYNRDEQKLMEIQRIMNLIPEGTVLNTGAGIVDDWGLQGEFVRYRTASLDPLLLRRREYLLIKTDQPVKPECLQGYLRYNLPNKNYLLYRRYSFN